MFRFIPRFLLLFTVLAGQASIAGEQQTLASVKPLALLHKILLEQQPAPDILLPADQNLHDYSLSVSDLQRVRNTHVLFWLGSGNEVFLQRLETRFAEKTQWIALAPDTHHAWLNPATLPDLVNRLADALAELHPQSAELIAAQQQQLLADITQWQAEWREKLAPYRQTSLVMGHTAFLPMAEQLGLEKVQLYLAGHSHGHHRGGTRDLISIQQQLASGDIYCLIEEPDISFAQLKRRYPKARSVLLEPMAASHEDFIGFLDHSAGKLLECLQTE